MASLGSKTPTVPRSGADLNIATARLQIPRIGVDAPIEPVGFAGSNLDVPRRNRWTGVGWFNRGPLPGQRGSAVIDGHLDRPGGVPAVFWNLHQLRVGDSVMVSDNEGHRLRFHVIKVDQYSPQRAPLQAIFADTSGKFLNLITCEGSWDSVAQQTILRRVVYTSLD
ncbi:hypothetical protein KSX_48380 [Ktedonospora formicarum]|uniref:Class F sortase n=1 Tax=Ktedonospora formicarum TaxID=2778364 RepID=A0A8J3MT08_9CHLR|nr:hypothetical protein KSX_48380 [Ktedonospora formicarum]